MGFAALALAGGWLARRGVLALPILRRRGVNLEARRGTDEPDLWLVAHVDSKSQPIPLLVRAVGIVLLILAGIAAITLAIAALYGHRAANAWLYVDVAAFVGTAPVVGSIVGKSSPGAIDNASGVATVLCVTAILPPECGVGILITDAEEYGLAGARAWCAETARRPVPVLNCDGVDDEGPLTLMWTRPRSERLERAMHDAALRAKQRLRVIPLVPGVLVDGLAFSDAGWECVTVSRGSLATLRRIHTRRDNLEMLQGTGIAITSLVVAAAAYSITERH